MQKISEVEQAITLSQELLTETKKRIQTTATKLSDAKSNVGKIQAEITAFKEKRQQALARGGDSKGLNDSLKKSESELELESETIAGLETFLKELQQEESELHLKISALPERILQLKSIELAAEYNSLALQMTPIIEALNEIYHKTGGNSNNKQDAVIFYPMEGVFEKLPKIFFDDDGVNLETFVSRHPGFYHTNVMLAESEKYFYVWGTHRQNLISGK